MKMTITDILSIIKPLDVASIFNSLVIAIIGIVFVYKNSKSKAASEMHIKKKTELYKKYIERYMSVFSTDKKQEEINEVVKSMNSLRAKVLLYASPKVILALDFMWTEVLNFAKSEVKTEEKLNKTIEAGGKLVLAMRKDLILSNTIILSNKKLIEKLTPYRIGRIVANSMNDDKWKK